MQRTKDSAIRFKFPRPCFLYIFRSISFLPMPSPHYLFVSYMYLADRVHKLTKQICPKSIRHVSP